MSTYLFQGLGGWRNVTAPVLRAMSIAERTMILKGLVFATGM